jgi:hypothetical protein
MIWKCKPQLNLMNECLSRHNNTDEAYRRKLEFVRSGRADLPVAEQNLTKPAAQPKKTLGSTTH